MSRETYVMRGGRLVRKSQAAPRVVADRGPQVIGDVMVAVPHPSSGKMYDSKSLFRAETRARGCVEVGNDVRPPRKPIDMPSARDDIRRTISELGGGS